MRKALPILAVSLALGARQMGAIPSSQTLFVPVVAHLPASGGAAWVSDLVLLNPAGGEASAELAFLRAGQDNSSAVEISVRIPGNRALLLDDVVLKTFGQTSYGALRIRSNVSLVASSSTYRRAPRGFPGITEPAKETFQTPAVDEVEWASPAVRVLFVANRFRDIEASASVRDSSTNVGFFNPTPDAVSVSASLVDQGDAGPLGTQTFSLPAYGFLQIVDLFQAFGAAGVRSDNAILSIGASTGLPPSFQPASILAYAVRQTATFDGCGGFANQADFLLAQRIPE